MDCVGGIMYKIIILGMGLYGKQALQFLTRENVMFWTDNNEDLHEKLITSKRKLM